MALHLRQGVERRRARHAATGTRARPSTAGSPRPAGDAVLAGGALHPIATATTVRVRDGEVLVTDGPFSESAEVVGGFYVLAAADLDAAVALAALIPVDPGGESSCGPMPHGADVRPSRA